MGSSHHGSSEEEAKDRFISEMLGKAKPSFPQGRVHESDRGETAFAIAVDPRRKICIIRFTKPVDWLGLGAKETRDLATLLNEKAKQLEELTPKP